MRDDRPPEIEGQFRIIRGPTREPIVNSWPGLISFFGVPLAIFAVRLGQINGWW